VDNWGSAKDHQFPTLTSVNFHVIPMPFMISQDLPLDRALHAIADSTRRRILGVLKRRDSSGERSSTGQRSYTLAKQTQGRCAGLCAGDIEERIKLSQPTISHHMAILTKAGLVEAAKEGQWRWYRRNEKAIRQMIKGLRANI
jgi:DNA-binding transcriptional ArsR family regulator